MPPNNSLFRSLQIGSLRYWSDIPNVVKTQVFNSLDFVFDNREKDFVTEFPENEMVLQNREISLEFQKEFDLVYDTKEIEQETDCL